MAHFANRLFECIYHIISLLGFSSGSFSVGSSSKSKVDRKCDSKESYCINALPKHFLRHETCRDMTDHFPN